MPSTDRIPSVDPEAAERHQRAERAQSVVILAPNTICPGGEAELELTAMLNGGLSTLVIGWRQGRRDELVPGYRAAWDGDTSGWTLGTPWWWSRAARVPGGVGALSQHDEPMAAYQEVFQAGQAAAEASRAAHGTL